MLSSQDKQVLEYVDGQMQAATVAIAAALELDHAVVVATVKRLAQEQLVTTSPSFEGLGVRITTKGSRALQ